MKSGREIIGTLAYDYFNLDDEDVTIVAVDGKNIVLPGNDVDIVTDMNGNNKNFPTEERETPTHRTNPPDPRHHP